MADDAIREAMTLEKATTILKAKAERSQILADAERSFGRMGVNIARHHRETAEAIRVVLAAIQPPDETAVEAVAVGLWVEDARRAAPNVMKYRNAETFLEQPVNDIKRWKGLARAAIAAHRKALEP